MDTIGDVPIGDGEAGEEIARLEERIEALADAIERCRKLALMARIALGSGAALVVLMLLGAISAGPLSVIATIAAALGGIVLLGSNASTWTQTAAALAAAEARRNALIGMIRLRVVGEKTLH